MLTFDLHYDLEGYSVTTSVHRHDTNGLLPKGFGMEMYEKMLDSIDAQAHAVNHSIVHNEYRTLDISEKPMSVSEWQKLFAPLLTARGYLETENGEWEKEYILDSLPSEELESFEFFKDVSEYTPVIDHIYYLSSTIPDYTNNVEPQLYQRVSVLTIDGKDYNLHSLREISPTKDHIINQYYIIDEHAKSIFDLTIDLYLKDDGGYDVKTAVHKDDREHMLPRGLASRVYTVMLEAFEQFSQDEDVQLNHRVKREADYSRWDESQKLSKEKWYTLFGPILEEHGYEKVGEDEWEKVYDSQDDAK